MNESREPEVIAEGSLATSSSAQPEVEEELSEFIDLPNGKDLDDELAREITLRSLACLIVVAGPVSSGKTTLLLSLYEMFLEGSMDGWLFAGSATLHGFELRCHPSRISSGRDTSHTERTLTNREDGVHYLHLQLVSKSTPSKAVDFLFTDLTGEVYEDACHSTDDCKDLTFASRADHFVLLLDGKKVTLKSTRHAAVQEAATLLRSMLDSGALGLNSFVEVVITKSDYLDQSGSSVDEANFIMRITKDFSSEFRHRVAALTFFKVAARPKAGRGVPFGYGLQESLGRWAATGPRFRTMNLERIPKRSQREFDNFYFSRTIPK